VIYYRKKRTARFKEGGKLCESAPPLGCHEALRAEQDIIYTSTQQRLRIQD